MWLAWFEVLADGFKVFNESISDVQIKLDSLLDDIKFALINGTGELRHSKSTVIDLLVTKQKNGEHLATRPHA